MKRIIALTAAAATLILALSCSQTDTADVQVGPYTVSVIEPGVYHIQDFNDENPAGETFDAEGNKTHFNNCSDMYLLVGRSKALLIDLSNNIKWADNAEESLRSIVAERTKGKDLIITFTHNHGDHTGMLYAYRNDPDVAFACPKADFQNLLTQEEAAKWPLYNEGFEFDLGGMKVQTIAVPGHTPGSMVFYLKGHNIIFSGDAIGSGHGVWIFNRDAFYSYVSAVYHLAAFVEDPANGIDKDALKFYGGHYWQRDWLDYAEGQEQGWQYLSDMKDLIDQIERGEAATEPSNLGMPNLDTYFRNGEAIITWNAAEAKEYTEEYSEKIVYRDEDLVFRQIDEHTWEGNGHMVYNESVYLIEGEEKALLIDAGTMLRHLDKAVAKLTDKPVTLVATHVHGDHTGMAINLFPEIYINPADVAQMGMNLTDASAAANMYKCKFCFLQDGMVFDLGGREIEVVYTPGHTPGSTTFIDKEKHYGFSGDSFGSTNLLLTSNFSTLVSTTARMEAYMKKFGIEKLYPGHYNKGNLETLQRVQDLNRMAHEMLDGTRTGVTEEGMLGLNSAINDFGVTVRYNYPNAVK
ncbi:MAG: MBL fold metallo-hydrolase [Bacteroidia bacterium]|nr:MBL fold metallo-hydrolase [Bacteroidia bacterium]